MLVRGTRNSCLDRRAWTYWGAEFRAMRRKPILVNTARGGLVADAALVEALDEGLIAGAGFVTPHVAWASDEAQQALADQLVDNIGNFVAGRPTNLVGTDG